MLHRDLLSLSYTILHGNNLLQYFFSILWQIYGSVFGFKSDPLKHLKNLNTQ